MNYNGIISYIQRHSLPLSETVVTVPCNEFTITASMIKENLLVWLQNCDVVKEVKASHVLAGVAHDVSITFYSGDGFFELMEVE